MVDVETMLGEVVAGEARELPDVEVAVQVVEIRRLVDATDALWIRFLAEFDRRELWRADGARSAAAWLRRECRLVHPTTATALMVARASVALPATGAAFRAGNISFEHLRAIAPAAAPERREMALRADPIFARAAVWMNPRQMGNVVRTWMQLAEE